MLGKMNPFRSKGKVKYFDSNPRMKAEGIAYIIKVTMSDDMNKSYRRCVDEQIIFSTYPVRNELILSLSPVKLFLDKYPGGIVETEEYTCDIKSLKKQCITSQDVN